MVPWKRRFFWGNLQIYLNSNMSFVLNLIRFVLKFRLNSENSEKIYQVEDMLEAFDGLHKAARSTFTGNLITDEPSISSGFDFPSLPAESWESSRGSRRSATRAKWKG